MSASRSSPDGRRSLLAGLIGQGVGPSLTPELHEREALRQGIRYVYKVVELPDQKVDVDNLGRLLEYAVQLGFDGLNVTHPVKQMMTPLVDHLTPEVEAMGALNTVLIRDAVTFGHNTDVTGFGTALREGLPGVSLDAVVVLGAGGAGTAVAHALVDLGVEELYVVDPDVPRADQLVASVRGKDAGARVTLVDSRDLDAVAQQASGLVNATPVGMAAHPGMPCSPDLLHDSLWVADIVYRPLMTELLRKAAARGCQTMNGAGMAVHQAGDAFELITGLSANRTLMFRDFDEMVAAEVVDASSNASIAPPRDDQTDERKSQ